MRRAGVLLLLGVSCAVPQDIEEMEPRRIGNSPPRIVQFAPARAEVVTQRLCPEISFSLLGIEDFDRDDALEVRWFVNYGPDRTLPEVRPTTIPASPQMRDGIRSPPGDSFTLRPGDYGPGTFVVEAVVSDGFDPDPMAEPRGRAVLPDKDWDEVSWKLVITEASCL